jgi:hypothetical protein
MLPSGTPWTPGLTKVAPSLADTSRPALAGTSTAAAHPTSTGNSPSPPPPSIGLPRRQTGRFQIACEDCGATVIAKHPVVRFCPQCRARRRQDALARGGDSRHQRLGPAVMRRASGARPTCAAAWKRTGLTRADLKERVKRV